ncbi:hypothetical protein L6452_22663 [Arctium lappa]|uniref:Uncharacterized protein n=1 Tax=Arctium lappa TaxID=4217 RepID=A0ACB9B0S4_ARCLA|nr:hypothetical protein L6452_22663 [Arctium lappa]
MSVNVAKQTTCYIQLLLYSYSSTIPFQPLHFVQGEIPSPNNRHVGMGENQVEAQTGHGMGGEAQTKHDMGEEETGAEDDSEDGDYMVDDEYGMDDDFVVDMMGYYSTVDFDAEWNANIENLFLEGNIGDDVEPFQFDDYDICMV